MKFRSAEDQVTDISQMTEDGFQEKQHTVAVWIDMGKAFDKILSRFCKHLIITNTSFLQLLEEVANISSRIALQWIPGHCQIKTNEQCNSLAMNQTEVDMSWKKPKHK
ncbi:hypothetical protein RRG08_006519 [Elysia crispata]|uniref:RNase H type-1 domain-containing protein n=1 Tax=Elysia crispata TaxID=231223 RepID=A0AAE0YCA8_9GAST|nr:hypothetical protein RRG08_006519 [Elysia crispata]